MIKKIVVQVLWKKIKFDQVEESFAHTHTPLTFLTKDESNYIVSNIGYYIYYVSINKPFLYRILAVSIPIFFSDLLDRLHHEKLPYTRRTNWIVIYCRERLYSVIFSVWKIKIIFSALRVVASMPAMDNITTKCCCFFSLKERFLFRHMQICNTLCQFKTIKLFIFNTNFLSIYLPIILKSSTMELSYLKCFFFQHRTILVKL